MDEGLNLLVHVIDLDLSNGGVYGDLGGDGDWDKVLLLRYSSHVGEGIVDGDSGG